MNKYFATKMDTKWIILTSFIVILDCSLAKPFSFDSSAQDAWILEEQLCPEVASDEPQFFPHPKNCRLYYECQQGQLIVARCLPGLHFNPFEKTCQYPEDASCYLISDDGSQVVIPTIRPILKESANTTEEGTNSNISTVSLTEKGSTNLGTATKSANLEHDRVTQSDHNSTKPGQAQISEGSFEVHQTSHQKSDIGYKQAVRPATFNETNSTPESIENQVLSTSEVLSTHDEAKNPKKPAINIESIEFPKGKKKEATENKRTEETTAEAPSAVSTEFPEDVCSNSNTTFIPHECSAIHFYRCVRGHKIKMRCPEGRFFDSERLICDWPPRGRCRVTFTDDCTPTSVYFPDYDDPGAFYQCANGEFYKFQCPTELVFNRDLNVCDWPKNGADGTKYLPKVNRVNCYSGKCDEDTIAGASMNTTIRPSPQPSEAVQNFYITKDGWAPVVGSRPNLSENSHSEPKGWHDSRQGYASMSKWPIATTTERPVKTTESKGCCSHNSETSTRDETSGQRNYDGQHHLLTASTRDREDKLPVGWSHTRPWSPSTSVSKNSVIDLGSGRNVQVSIDTSMGVIDVTNNSSDITIHFKPNADFENKTLSTNLLLSKDQGVLTLKAGVKAEEETASFTVRMSG